MGWGLLIDDAWLLVVMVVSYLVPRIAFFEQASVALVVAFVAAFVAAFAAALGNACAAEYAKRHTCEHCYQK